jgi:ADP-ribose pyrophosphatase YjhB (NUDIX family)
VSTIRVKAIVALQAGNQVLLAEGYDTVKAKSFFRALGGEVEFGETAAAAAARELREELGIEVGEPRQIGVIESLFTCEGEPGHEIVFVFEAAWPETQCTADCVIGTESDGVQFECRWIPLGDLATLNVVPEGFIELLN